MTAIDSPNPAEVRKLGDAFAAVLAEWLLPSQLAEVRRRNATAAYLLRACCASHDYCDANMAMHEAFEKALGREPALDDRPDGAEAPDVALWNAAWNDGRARHLLDREAVQAAARDHLTALYEGWTKAEALPDGDAEELLHADLSPHQRRWLSAFVLLWEAMEADTDSNRDATATAIRNAHKS